MNEPIADATRGILDGHIVLSRKIATQNHFPAIDVLESISRLMPAITSPEQLALAGRLRQHLAVYERNEDLINIGAYEKGANPDIDAAITMNPSIRGFLRQDVSEVFTWPGALSEMASLLGNEG